MQRLIDWFMFVLMSQQISKRLMNQCLQWLHSIKIKYVLHYKYFYITKPKTKCCQTIHIWTPKHMTQRKTCSIFFFFFFAAYAYSIYLFIYKEGKLVQRGIRQIKAKNLKSHHCHTSFTLLSPTISLSLFFFFFKSACCATSEALTSIIKIWSLQKYIHTTRK